MTLALALALISAAAAVASIIVATGPVRRRPPAGARAPTDRVPAAPVTPTHGDPSAPSQEALVGRLRPSWEPMDWFPEGSSPTPTETEAWAAEAADVARAEPNPLPLDLRPGAPRAMPANPRTPWTAEITWERTDDRCRFCAVAANDAGGDPVVVACSPWLEWPPRQRPSVSALPRAVALLEQTLLDAGWKPLGSLQAWYAKRFAWSPWTAVAELEDSRARRRWGRGNGHSPPEGSAKHRDLLPPAVEADVAAEPERPMAARVARARPDSAGPDRAATGGRWRSLARRSIVKSLAASGGSQLALIVSGVLVARSLGPEDRGYLALLVMVAGVFSLIGTIGLPPH